MPAAPAAATAPAASPFPCPSRSCDRRVRRDAAEADPLAAPRGGREVHILHAAREEPDLLPPLLEGVEPSEVSYSAGNGDTALIVLSAKHDRPDLVRALHAAGAELDAASLLAEMGEHHRVPENFVRKVREAIEGQD